MTKRKAGLGPNPAAQPREQSWIRPTTGEGKQCLQTKQTLQTKHDEEEKPGEKRPTVYRGLRPGWRRKTIIIREQHRDTLRAIALAKGRREQEIIDEALAAYLGEHAEGVDVAGVLAEERREQERRREVDG